MLILSTVKFLKVLSNSLLGGLFFCLLISLLLADLNINMKITPALVAAWTINLMPIYGLLFALVAIFAFFIIQFFFGMLRLGNLIKYVPYPVVSGFMNGIAFILIYEQITPLIGASTHVSLLEVLYNPIVVQPFTFIIGLTTIIVIFFSKRFIKAVPASLIGLVTGTSIFYAFKIIGGVSALGPVIGNFYLQWPKPDILPKTFLLLENIDIVNLFPRILITGFVLGSIGSLESLLSSVAADNIAGTRHKSNRELIGQGIGNIMNSLFSALPSAGSELHNISNYRAGGRTRLSSLV